MARRSLPIFTVLWQRHEALYCEVFLDSLQRLARKKIVSGDEDAISEMLCPILREICFELGQTRDIEISEPNWEGPIQPVLDCELTGGKKRKRPDFTCKLVNPWAISSEGHEISFHIECKRLGLPTSSSWVLNRNYVTKGMQRFDYGSHEYGKRASSGMMIGYLIDMEPEKVLKDVNGFMKEYLPDFPDINMQCSQGIVFQSRQHLERKHVKPQTFDLIHMWANLRTNYQP